MKGTTQQVNLYQRQFRKTRVALSAVQVARLTLVLIACLATISAVTHQKTQLLNASAARLAAHAQQLASHNNTFRQINSGDQQGVSVAVISELKRERGERQLVLDNLHQYNVRSEHLFSGFFEGLARRTVDGLWLNHIDIDKQGNEITLQGSAQRAELIPEFIKKLQKEPAFRGVVFKAADVEQSYAKNHDNFLHFSLLTHLGEQGADQQ